MLMDSSMQVGKRLTEAVDTWFHVCNRYFIPSFCSPLLLLHKVQQVSPNLL